MIAPPPKPVTPGLYLVATPIGNLRDITLRALDVLAAADVVLAEDTRVTARLLTAYGLKKKLVRYDDHIGESVRPKVLAALMAGEVVAQVSDAGTPLVSDPGYKLALDAIAAGLAVHPIPGPSSPLAALTLAGLPSDRFLFAGFTPHKAAGRRTMFEELRPVRATLIFFETGPRLRASLTDMAAVFGADRPAAVARELTKLYEECVRGRLGELVSEPRLEAPKGEIVVLVGPGEETAATEADADAALTEALSRMGPADAASEVARTLGLNRKTLYRRALELQGR
jgi:16S rRNA (cytidine1402-2'-O)-methyltransferase